MYWLIWLLGLKPCSNSFAGFFFYFAVWVRVCNLVYFGLDRGIVEYFIWIMPFIYMQTNLVQNKKKNDGCKRISKPNKMRLWKTDAPVPIFDIDRRTGQKLYASESLIAGNQNDVCYYLYSQDNIFKKPTWIFFFRMKSTSHAVTVRFIEFCYRLSSVIFECPSF
jgi:hypothetical protein